MTLELQYQVPNKVSGVCGIRIYFRDVIQQTLVLTTVI